MLKKIRLKNFMSHQSSEFELVKGVNVLTGPNNSGKSAVISAIQMLADLPVREGDYMVRHGASECEVTIVTDEDDELTWQRKGSIISLTINGERHVRLQNDRDHYLEKLHKFLRLRKVSGNDSKDDFDIHFATQKDPIFLLNEPPARAALFFASSSDAGRLFEVRDRFKDLVKSKKKEQQRTVEALEQQNKILAHLVPLDAMGDQIKFVLDTHTQFPKDKERLQHSESLLHDWGKQAYEFKCISSTYQLLQTLLAPPVLGNTTEIEVHRKALVKETNSVCVQTERNGALSILVPPPVIHSAQGLSKELNVLQRTEKSVNALEKIQTILDGLEAKPEIEDAESLALILKKMQDLTFTKTRLASSQLHLGKVRPPPSLEQEFPVSQLLHDLRVSFYCEKVLRVRVDKLVELNRVPDVVDLQQIEKVYIGLRNLRFRKSLSDRMDGVLSKLHMPPAIVDILRLEQHLPALRDAQRRHNNHLQRTQLGAFFHLPPQLEEIDLLNKHLKNYVQQAANVENLTLRKQELDQELRVWMIEHPSCPICGGDLNMERLQGSVCNEK